MEFGEKLRLLRQEKKLTQGEAAELIDVSLRTYKGYELGERLPKNKKTYVNISNRFGVGLRYLMDSNEEFVVAAKEKHGYKGAKDAESLIANASAFFAGGEVSDQDKQAVLMAIQEAFFKTKEINKKYTPKVYRKD